MKQNSDIAIKFPNLYRHDLLKWAAWEQRLSQREVSQRAKINPRTAGVVFAGRANNRKVWPVANVLGIDWAALHNFKLKESEFHLAVNGKKGG
jgi:hypothetical protein